MTSTNAGGRAPIAMVAILSALLSGTSTGSHASSDGVGQQSLEPTTVYFSQHRQQENEAHLHAVDGFESALCLACNLSLRQKPALEVSPALFSLDDGSDRIATAPTRAHRGAAPSSTSSRGPPRS